MLACTYKAAIATTLIILGGSCTGLKPYRKSKPAQEVQLRGTDPTYDSFLEGTITVAEAQEALGGAQVMSFSPTVQDYELRTLSAFIASQLRQAYVATHYPVTIDGMRAQPNQVSRFASKLKVGTTEFDVEERTVELGPDKVTLGERPAELHAEPVNFDIGAGIGVMTNTSGAANNDVMGVFAAVRGYPFGHWYTLTKNKTEDGVLYEYKSDPDSSWANRISVNFGISNTIGDDSIKDPALFLGLGFDVSPQFALVAGVSWFQLEDSLAAGNDQCSFFIGTTLSLRALADLLALKANGFSNK